MTFDQEALVLAHDHVARLIGRALARRARHLSLERDDLVQIARLGLCKAAADWNPEAHPGVPFEAFARLRIRGACVDAMRKMHPTTGVPRGERWRGLFSQYSGGGPQAEPVDMERAVDGAALLRLALELPPRERVCVLGWAHDIYGSEIAAHIGYCQARVSQIRQAAIARLQEQHLP